MERVIRTLTALAATRAFAYVLAPAAQADTFTVDSAADAGGTCPAAAEPCTLRQAIHSAGDHPGDDTVAFAIGADATIGLTEGPLLIFAPEPGALTIAGPGADHLTVTVSPESESGSFHFGLLGGTPVTISGMTLTGAGASINSKAPLTLDRMRITGNVGTILSEQGGSAGAISSGGQLTIRDSSITGNFVANVAELRRRAADAGREIPVSLNACSTKPERLSRYVEAEIDRGVFFVPDGTRGKIEERLDRVRASIDLVTA